MRGIRTKFICPRNSNLASDYITYILAVDVDTCRETLRCNACKLDNLDLPNYCHGPLAVGTWEEIVHG